MKRMKQRILPLVLVMAVLFSVLPMTGFAAACNHQHDDACGYAEAMKCSHEHAEDCGYVEGKAAIPCDMECEGDSHAEGCAYAPAVDEIPCKHKHNAACGYAEAVACGHKHDDDCGVLSLGDSDSVAKTTIAAFDELDEAVLYQVFDVDEIAGVDELTLPETLTGEDADGGALSIEGVAWDCFQPATGFDPAAMGVYTFAASLPQGYALADGVTLPEINVVIMPGDVEAETRGAVIGGYVIDNDGDWTGLDTWLQNTAQYGDTLTINADRGDSSTAFNINLYGKSITIVQTVAGPLENVYITSTAGVTLTIDGLNITAPQGTMGVSLPFPVYDSYAAINLATGSTLVVEGVNTVKGGMERAGVHVGPSQLLTITGTGRLNAYGNARNDNPQCGAGIGGDGDPNGPNPNVGEGCGDIIVSGNVTVFSDKLQKMSTHSYFGGNPTEGSITIQDNAVVILDGRGYTDYMYAADIIIDGGSVQSDSVLNNPKNSQGYPLNRVDIPAGSNPGGGVTVTGDGGYTYSAVTGPNGEAYIWLPSGGSYEIHVDRGGNGGYTEVYVVDTLSTLSRDGGGKITSNVEFTQPNYSYSNDLRVDVVTITPSTYNSGTVKVEFSIVPSIDGVVEVSKDNFATTTVLTFQSKDVRRCEYSYSGLDANTTYKVRVRDFEDGNGYANPVHDSASFTTGGAPILTATANLSFGNQTVHATSAAQTITVTGTNLVADIIVSSSTNSAFTVTKATDWDNRTGGTLNVVFAPMAATAYTATITISSLGTQTAIVNLSGKGVVIPEPNPTYEYRTITDAATGVSVTGHFTPGTTLNVMPKALHAAGACAACDEIRAKDGWIALYDVSITGSHSGNIELRLPVPVSYNGQSTTVWHCKASHVEKLAGTAQDGAATITVSSLSPFAVFASGSNSPTNAPQTGDASNLWLWLTLMILSLTLCGFSVWQCIKHRKIDVKR